MIAVGHVDELRGDPDLPPGLPDAPLEYRLDSEGRADPADVLVLSEAFKRTEIYALCESRPGPRNGENTLSARTTRGIHLLRAHGLIHKIPTSHRCRLIQRGQLLTAAVSAARSATLKSLIAKAA